MKEVRCEAPPKMGRDPMHAASGRHSEQKSTIWPQQASHLLDCADRVRDMLQDLRAQNGVQGFARQGDTRDLAAYVRLSIADCGVIVGPILAVGEKGPVLARTSTHVENDGSTT